MKTALITTEHRQQVVLQPENLREHRVLQMLTQKNADIQVFASELEITEQGYLQKRENSWRDSNDKPVPLMVQVQGPAPVVREPDVQQALITRVDLNNLILGMSAMAAYTREEFFQHLRSVQQDSRLVELQNQLPKP